MTWDSTVLTALRDPTATMDDLWRLHIWPRLWVGPRCPVWPPPPGWRPRSRNRLARAYAILVTLLETCRRSSDTAATVWPAATEAILTVIAQHTNAQDIIRRMMRRAPSSECPNARPSLDVLVALCQQHGWDVAMETVNHCLGLTDHLNRMNGNALRRLRLTLLELLDRTAAFEGSHGPEVRVLAERLRGTANLPELAVVLHALGHTSRPGTTAAHHTPPVILTESPWVGPGFGVDRCRPCPLDPVTGRLDVQAQADHLFPHTTTATLPLPPVVCLLVGLRTLTPPTTTVYHVLWELLRPTPTSLVEAGRRVQRVVRQRDDVVVVPVVGDDDDGIVLLPVGSSTLVLNTAAAVTDLPQPGALLLRLDGAAASVRSLADQVAAYLDPRRHGWCWPMMVVPPDDNDDDAIIPITDDDQVPWAVRWFPACGHWVLHRVVVVTPSSSHLPILPDGALNVPTIAEVRRCPQLSSVRTAALAASATTSGWQPDVVRDLVWRLDFGRLRVRGPPPSVTALADAIAILTYWCASPVLQPPGLYDRVRSLTTLPPDAVDRRLDW